MNFADPKITQSVITKKLRYFYLIVIFAFFILIIRLAYLQLVKGEYYYKLSEDNIVRIVEIPSVRGLIKDRKGRVIATNLPSYQVYIIPHFFDMSMFETFVNYLKLGRDEKEKLKNKILSAKRVEKFTPILVKEDIDEKSLTLLEINYKKFPGVEIKVVPKRYYPYGNIGAHVIGYVGEISEEELKKLKDKGYKVGDIIGKAGIEKSMEEVLRGISGWKKEIVDARGVVKQDINLRDFIQGEEKKDPQPGKDITLTIDMQLEKIIFQELGGHLSAAVVVVDVNSGEILAMVNKPEYDPNELSKGVSKERMVELLNDPFIPLFDKSIQGLYSPGSTFKFVTAIAALEEGLISPSYKVRCEGVYNFGGRRFRCSQPHGEVDLLLALIESCNIYFYKLAELVGIERIYNYAKEFGFGEKTGIILQGESRGVVPNIEWYVKRGIHFHLGYSLNTAIGQGNTLVNLLQLVFAYAAIANGGTIYSPLIVKRIESSDGKYQQEFKPKVRRKVNVKPENLALLSLALTGVVHHPKGTAYDSHEFVDGIVTVAGKTGTAQVSRKPLKEGMDLNKYWYFNRDHAWFTGYAPAEMPKIGIVVLIEHGGTGGKNAAPIALNIIRRYFEEIEPIPPFKKDRFISSKLVDTGERGNKNKGEELK